MSCVNSICPNQASVVMISGSGISQKLAIVQSNSVGKKAEFELSDEFNVQKELIPFFDEREADKSRSSTSTSSIDEQWKNFYIDLKRNKRPLSAS